MEEYANRTSIHGIGYIFAHDLGLFERLLWMIAVLGFLAAVLLLSANLWIQWEEQQVEIFSDVVLMVASSKALHCYRLHFV